MKVLICQQVREADPSEAGITDGCEPPTEGASLLAIAVTDAMSRNVWGTAAFISSYNLQPIIVGNQGKQSRTQKQELKQRPRRNAAY